MIVLSNSNAQVLSVGQSATFDSVLLHTGCGECHRPNSGAVCLTQKNAIYEIGFNCNIGTTDPGNAQLALCIDSSPISETTVKTVTAAAGDLENVSASTFLQTCRCCNGILTLTNTGTVELTIDANPRVSVKRVA